MDLKCIFALFTLSVLPWSASAAPAAPKVVVKSEVASPVVLENTQDKNYLKISLVGYPLPQEKRSPINLALVIDRSTSMSGDRIENARKAAIAAVNMLNGNDTLSVVAYDSGVEVVIPATKVKDTKELINKINKSIEPRGMTALFAGVSKGIDQVSKHLDKEQVNRIVLLSDGQANVGPTSNSELAELAKLAAKKGIAITTIGIGDGYNEDLMTTIAGYSDGNHAFVEQSSDLEKTFAYEFNDAMSVVAQDVVVVIKTADKVTPVRLLGRDGSISGNTVTVKLNQLYSNQEKYVLLEVIPAKGSNAQSKPLADVNVRYANLSTKQVDTFNEKVAVRYSQSAKDVSAAQVDEVLVDSAIQKAAIENERAVELMDAGKMEEAKQVFSANAAALESLPVSAAPARQKAEASAQKNKDLMGKMESDSKESTRKAVKEQNYNIKTQKNQ
ncbi:MULTISPECIES: vWA domain-containing protein [Serratia]|uniref:vWA domain-containing protein n=1 Tax=Serratia TaxID=613 RepID=UPI000E0F48A7|nr:MULTISPECIES: VWA domain-containing protein [Serratia]QXN63441.1 VWA domain-containing protein [Serratia fonticola]RDL25919.1 Ca-activated chloride channel family protein [Serratia fonticola]UAN58220.1 VWA domain-containing protein [Serratia sp. JSRIV004]